MSSWKGKTRGGLLGYKIFVFVIQRFGLSAAYFLLRFVAAYFVFSAPQQSRSIFQYFREIVGYSFLKSLISIYKSYFLFGQTLVDKVAIGAGMKSRFTYTFDGNQHLDTLGKTGGIVLSAHLGNWEVAGFLLKENQLTTNILMFQAEHERIKDYLKDVMKEHNLNVIAIKGDMSHVFQINDVIQKKEVLCVHGDRFIDGSRLVRKQFMGREAFFPIGPFAIASKLRTPFTMAYAMRGKNRVYHLSATPVEIAGADPEVLLDNYVKHLEEKLRKYPLQWFNFYDFWSEDVRGAEITSS